MVTIRQVLILGLVFWGLLAACAPLPPLLIPKPPDSMVLVPAGWFLMGEDDGPSSNQPQRQVYVDAFSIDRTEVTNAAFAQFVEETGYQPAGWTANVLPEHAAAPAAGILWREADAYCRWAGLRLPTEAEWEKAARGTDGRLYPWGNTWDGQRANTAEHGQGGPMPVGSFPTGASPYGALDMAGNVAEWVADYFDFAYYREAPDHNPRGPDKIMDHGLRGGSWASSREDARTFRRDSSHSVRSNRRVGFRCAR